MLSLPFSVNLHGVANRQIDNYLPQAVNVANGLLRNLRGDGAGEFQALLVGAEGQDVFMIGAKLSRRLNSRGFQFKASQLRFWKKA